MYEMCLVRVFHCVLWGLCMFIVRVCIARAVCVWSLLMQRSSQAITHQCPPNHNRPDPTPPDPMQPAQTQRPPSAHVLQQHPGHGAMVGSRALQQAKHVAHQAGRL
jgi:hypothetical protein